jgi:hypothetical protein
VDGGAWAGRPANDVGDGPPPRDAPAPPGAAKQLFRFGLGLAVLTRERMGAILAASSAATGAPTPLQTTSEQAAPRPGDAALGLVLGAADAGLRARPALRARWLALTASARRLSEPLARACSLIGWLPGVPRRAAHWRAWRASGERRLARWAAAGRRERAESRAVARAAITMLRETMLARVSESPDLKEVIREQSAGIAVTAVAELRERSAKIDDLAEGAVSRLLGRGPSRRAR